MTKIVIVNACPLLADADVAKLVPLIDKFDRENLKPAYGLDDCQYTFLPRGHLPDASDRTVWPIFLNLHSTDPGALGWHNDDKGRIFARVFVGDCFRYKVDWVVDLTHEAWEMRGNPALTSTVSLSPTVQALHELCDPVEDDLYAIPIASGVKFSDFVLPAYWRPSHVGEKYDFGGHLRGPCPMLASGGYQSLYEHGQWVQKTARLLNGEMSWRSVRAGRVQKVAKVLGIEPT